MNTNIILNNFFGMKKKNENRRRKKNLPESGVAKETNVSSTKHKTGSKAKKSKKNENEEEYYEVEKILGHKLKAKKKGKFKHLIKVKWKGYKKVDWYDEDDMRRDIEDEIVEYFKQVELKEKNRKKTKCKRVVREKKKDVSVVKCLLSHNSPNDFRLTENYWEVSKTLCQGGCKKDYTNESLCNSKNPVWVCEGNKKSCYCNILYCNDCYMEKFERKGGRRTMRRLK